MNLDEYLDPEIYDLENPDFEPDGSFYLEIAKEAPGSVLELGCGTGRLAIPLARRGLDMTGLDIVPEMLARARQKSADLPICWIEADARDFHLGRKFSLIFESGSVFMHMLTRPDQEAFLSCAREHLAPGGRLVICLFFPHSEDLVTDPVEKEWFSYQDAQGRTIRVSGNQSYDELKQLKTETAIRRIIDSNGVETVRVAPLTLRYTYPEEMEAILDQAGFKILERCGGPDRSPPTDDSRYMIYICTGK